MLLAEILHRVNTLIVVMDAVVIGMFGAFGTSKAIAFGVAPPPRSSSASARPRAAACSGTSSWVFRCRSMHVGSLYAVAVGAGGTFIVIDHELGMTVTLTAVIGIVMDAVIRVLAVVFDVSLPEQRRLYRRKVAAKTGEDPNSEAPTAAGPNGPHRGPVWANQPAEPSSRTAPRWDAVCRR